MTARPKIKLCWNCEGRVSFKEENCPYCGVYLSPSSDGGSDLDEPHESDGPALKQYSPPYRMQAIDDNNAPRQNEPPRQSDVNVKAVEPEQATEASEIKLIMITLSLLSGGALFLLFGLVLLLFSQDGFFTLKWNASLWYAYLAAGVVMLFFGWRALEKFGDSES